MRYKNPSDIATTLIIDNVIMPSWSIFKTLLVTKLLPLPRRERYIWHVSVCLLPTSHKNYQLSLQENLTWDISLYNEVTIKFWEVIRINFIGSHPYLDLDVEIFLPLWDRGNSADPDPGIFTTQE